MNLKSASRKQRYFLLFGSVLLVAACNLHASLAPVPPSDTASTQFAAESPAENEASDFPAGAGDNIFAPEPADPIPLIWDDDGSPDGVLALLYLFKHPSIDVRAVTVSCGEAHPVIFAENLERMLGRIDRKGIPVGAGSETPLEGTNVFPDSWRSATDTFWGAALPADGNGTVSSSSEVITSVLQQSSKPVTVFVSGNHTNIAEVFRADSETQTHIELLEIMGGALFVPGNINSDWPDNPNQAAEWNIWVDPIAADEVFQAGVPIQLMPLDATEYVVWTEQDAAVWEASGSPEGILAAEILRWMLASWYPEGVYAWDLMAAVDLTNPELCSHSDVYVRVNTQPGIEQGQTIVEDEKVPNTSVCLIPSAEEIKAQVAAVFQLP